MPNGIAYTATDEINFIKHLGMDKTVEDRRKLLETYLRSTMKREDWTPDNKHRIVAFLNMSIAQCH